MTLTVMVKRASPAARRMLGRVKLDGQKNSDTMLNQHMTSSAIAAASGERLNQESAILFANRKADRFITHAPQ